MRAIALQAFLGRGTHSPLQDILNHVGLQYDETAPTRATSDMMCLVGPDSMILRLEEELSALTAELDQRYGKASRATGADKARYADLQTQLRTARQGHARRVLDLCRKDHFATKNNEELRRQLSNDSSRAAPPQIRSVYFLVPERRRLAALFGNFDDDLSEASIVRKKIEVTIGLIKYAWIVEKKDQAVLLDPAESEPGGSGPGTRPWFASMIRQPGYASPRCSVSKREGSHGAPAQPSQSAEKSFICMFCKNSVKRRNTMWNCVDKHIAKLIESTGSVACPLAGCETKDSFPNEMQFKHHAQVFHNIKLRPPKGSETQVRLSSNEAYCSVRTSPTLSVPYALNTEVDVPLILESFEHDGTEDKGRLASPYPELPDTDSARPLERQWELSSRSDRDYSEPGSVFMGVCPGGQPWTGSQPSLEDASLAEQLDETIWDTLRSPPPPYEAVVDAGRGHTPALFEPEWTFMEPFPEIHPDLLDPALREDEAPTNAYLVPQDGEMEDSTIILTNVAESSSFEPREVEIEDSTSILRGTSVYGVERLLEKRGNMFYILWKDGTRSWGERLDISDDLVDPFEASWEGYHLGVEVLYERPKGRFRLRFKDWPWGNVQIWATRGELSPELRAQWPRKQRRRGRNSIR